jgi:hypothetical protein
MKNAKKVNNMDEPKLILKKTKVPVDWRAAQKGQSSSFYEPSDLQCGGVIDLYGRLFLLLNCDNSTRKHYDEMGIEQLDVPIIQEAVDKIVHPIPILGDGFLPIGSAEDTLATVYGMPKSRKDEKKIMRNQGKLIRCKAKMCSEKEIDKSRVFFITLFLEDDTLQVFEDVKRNSGIWGGNFLRRGKYMNEIPSDGSDVARAFIPQDMYLGNVICVNGNLFRIIEMDNVSLKFCENYPEEFPMSDSLQATAALLQRCIKGKIDLRAKLSSVDKNLTGRLTCDAFITKLDSLGLVDSLNDQELLTLIRKYKDGSGDQYTYGDLCDTLSQLYYFKSGRTDSNSAGGSQSITELNNLINLARSKTIQWRRFNFLYDFSVSFLFDLFRALRKDKRSLKGKIMLGVLSNIFYKQGIVLSDDLKKEIVVRYFVPSAVAAPIVKVKKIY